MRVPFLPPAGIVSDDTTFATPGLWADGSNVRFRLGKPEMIGGFVDALSGSTLTGVCRNVFAWTNANGSANVCFGTHSKLQLWYGGALYDITPSGLIAGSQDSAGEGSGYGAGTYGSGSWSDPALTYFARTWSLTTYGDNLIASPRGGTVYEWTGDTAVAATAVTNAPTQIDTCLVTPERQILAFGCNEETSGNYNPLCIRGSDIENITSWTTSVTNNAFEHILEGGGRIVAAHLIGAFIAVWTDRALYLGEFVGDPGQAYRFDRIGQNCGLIGPNAVTVLEQTAYWLGTDKQFRTWSLGGVPQVLTCPIHRDFKDNLVTAQKEKVVAVPIAQYGEVWWFYPDTRDGTENSRYVAFSVAESIQSPVWFRGQLARTGAVDAATSSYPVMTTQAGVVYYHENGEDADGSGLAWHIQSADTYIDEGNRAVMLRGIVPDFEEQDGDVSLTVFVRSYPMAAATTKGPYTIGTSATKKDFRASGRLVAMKLSGTADMRLGRPVFDAVLVGER